MGRWGERKVFREKVRERVWRHLDRVFQALVTQQRTWRGAGFCTFNKKQSQNEAVAKGLASGRRRSQNNRDPTVYNLVGGARHLGLYLEMRSHWRFLSVRDAIYSAFQGLTLAAVLETEWSWGQGGRRNSYQVFAAGQATCSGGLDEMVGLGM